jgi:hypothetical protein
MKLYRLLLLGGLIALVAACGKKADVAHAHGGAHAHQAPHGGVLVELGDHGYNVELLRDRATGKLTAWILDGHAEKFIRLPAPSFELIAMPGGKFTPLTLKAVATPATGETVGNTSQFEVQADWLKTADTFAGIFTLEIRGTKFEQVAYQVP